MKNLDINSSLNLYRAFENTFRDFPGSPVVKTLGSHQQAWDMSLIPGQGTKI